ncbi:MAG TPA: VanW family protein [Aestuariivirga sp.]|nr:VanW family protein [Aestuariivirga sp.]
MKALPKSLYRSPLRMALGKAWFAAKRRGQWYLPGKRYATTRSSTNLYHEHASHRTPLLRHLKGADMWLQHNKVDSLIVAASCIDGILLKPGETFSFWRLVGKPTARRGFKIGMVLRNGTVAQGMGGGLCQMTNLIYWMALHTELSIIERWRHGFDVFPDEGRSQPFASGATCSYNYIDLQIGNNTEDTYQLRIRVEGDYLHGEWLANVAPRYTYRIVERDHAIRTEWWGGYSRHNALYRVKHGRETGIEIGEEFITENHAIMMYAPLLENLEPLT